MLYLLIFPTKILAPKLASIAFSLRPEEALLVLTLKKLVWNFFIISILFCYMDYLHLLLLCLKLRQFQFQFQIKIPELIALLNSTFINHILLLVMNIIYSCT